MRKCPIGWHHQVGSAKIDMYVSKIESPIGKIDTYVSRIDSPMEKIDTLENVFLLMRVTPVTRAGGKSAKPTAKQN